ncbi:MAG: hypothetical protein Q8O83_05015 [bacterium]|nr:hypothetical protein [bacterium]
MVAMGFEGYFKNINCFIFLKTQVSEEAVLMPQRGSKTAEGEKIPSAAQNNLGCFKNGYLLGGHFCYNVFMSKSLEIARDFLGKEVRVKMNRPLGSHHPEHGFLYEANYGFISGVKAPDGEDLDAYYLGVHEPLDEVDGVCIAIAHRKNNDDDKLIVVPKGMVMSDEEIAKAIHFQEQWFDTEILRA